MNVAFIGLGKMGAGMARNLLRAGHTVTVYNRTPAKAEEFASQGGRAAPSAAEACRVSEAVFTMLADDRSVEEVVFAKDGVAAGLKPGGVHISATTMSTALARRLDQEHTQRGQAYLSAPVFGRPDAAEAKNLVVIPAGRAEVIERCRALFDAIGRRTFVAGSEPWQANALKLCGNFMIASMIETFGEAFATLCKAKVAPGLFLEAMNTLFGSPVMANYGHIIAEEKFKPAPFELTLGYKDVRLVLETAQELASPMPLASLIRDHMLTALALGQSEMDWASTALVSARNAGLDGFQ
ncbi:MAG TPA: NAD(P)-dependent oxidoreductase [Bryobacteraceae bacterium]|nr:NAD(P)-dependent oxidoreductase [Bryobacteraceae bacterium]